MLLEVTSPTHTINSNTNNVYTISGDGDVVILIRHFHSHHPFAHVEPEKASDLMSSGLVVLNYFSKFSAPSEFVFGVDRSNRMAGKYVKCAAITM